MLWEVDLRSPIAMNLPIENVSSDLEVPSPLERLHPVVTFVAQRVPQAVVTDITERKGTQRNQQRHQTL